MTEILLLTLLPLAGFLAGALTVIITRIMIPARHRISQERRDLNNITAAFNALPKPKTHIPSTIRKRTK